MERLGLGLMGSAHQGLELVHDLRQAIQRRLRTEVLAVVARRETRDRRAGRDVANHAALHRHPRAATDAHVIGDPGLTGEEHIVPHVRAPGDPDAGGNEAPRPDADVVPHLDQVVDFRSRAHHRVVHAATVDRGVGPDLHVVPDDAAADLRDLARQLGVLARDVPEPVRPQPRPGVDDDPVTDARPTVAHDVRVEQPLVAELHAVPQHRARPHTGVLPQPHAAPGRGVRLGKNARVGAGAVLGDGVQLGDEVLLYSHVVCYSGTRIGHRVIIHAGARLGSDGFGYVPGENGELPRKIPQVGRCIIGDDVEIGANTTIDRGSVDDTVVGPGTKIDNLVQVGHNVRIGARCLIAATVGIAGSTHQGDDVFLAGQAGIADHVSIGRGARVTVQGGVIGNIPAGATVTGFPARDHREYFRAQAALYRLAKVVNELEALVRAAHESQP